MVESKVDIVSNLWAKKDERDGVFLWLPLKQHLIDTYNIIDLLWEHWLAEGQKQFIVQSLSSKSMIDAKKVIIFLGAMHDIGKATPAFQTQESYIASKDLDNQMMANLAKLGLIDFSDNILLSRNKSKHALAGQVLLAKYEVKEDISSVIGSHHGLPINSRNEYQHQLDAYYENYYFSRKHETLWSESQKSLLEWGLAVSEFNNVSEIPTIQQPALVLLSGLLIMADWIASNTKFFPLFLFGDNQDCNQTERIKNGWLNWYKTYGTFYQNIPNVVELYEKRFGFVPNDIQLKVSSLIDSTNEPGIFILESPMGSGKTEVALIGVEQLSNRTDRQGVFFGLPTQATSNGMFDRIKKWLISLSLSDGLTKPLQLVHGKSYLNEEFAQLKYNKKRSLLPNNEDDNVVANEWFVGRKTAILDDYVIGTVDQFLMTALKQKHLALRHLGMSKKVIIIDEVHAYDAYMSEYLDQAIKWMGAYRTPVLILSATLPIKRRNELIKSYIEGRGQNFSEVDKPLRWEHEESYPLLTYSDGDKFFQKSDFSRIKDKQVTVKLIDDEQLLDVIESLMSDGGILGVIFNTVKRAQRFAKELSMIYGDDFVELIHSSFISTSRVLKEKRIIDSLGKTGIRPSLMIVVGTQVLEQSLDIDFDVLITDLAPIDLLLQRVGRLYRHEDRERPSLLSAPKLYILGTSSDLVFEEGSASIYGDYLLQRTQHYLPTVINIPSDISSLVQKVYGDVSLDYELHNDKVRVARMKHEIKMKQKKEKASNFRIKKPFKPYSDSIIGWLQNMKPDIGTEIGYAQVRDTQDSVEVIVVQKFGDSYRIFGEQESIEDKLDNPKASMKLAQQTIRLPGILSAPYIVDSVVNELEKFNLKRFADWQENVWLKGSLGIMFDENNQTIILGYLLKYDMKYGLSYERMNLDG